MGPWTSSLFALSAGEKVEMLENILRDNPIKAIWQGRQLAEGTHHICIMSEADKVQTSKAGKIHTLHLYNFFVHLHTNRNYPHGQTGTLCCWV